MMERLALFAALAALIEVTPGPDTFLVLRMTMRQGPAAGIWVGCGTATGIVAWATAAGLGLAAALEHSGWADLVLRALGAVLLLYLGVPSLLRPRGSRQVTGRLAAAGLRWWRCYGCGLYSAAANPANGLLYLALVPQFLVPGHRPYAMTLLLGAIDAAIAMCWQTAVATTAGRISRRLEQPALARGLERATGLMLMVFALLALARI
jgi:threonine/homoserine/homoserine lactone efflux protein